MQLVAYKRVEKYDPNKKNQTADDLYINGTFANFQQLTGKFNLPTHIFFFFKTYINISPDIPKEAPFETYVYNRLCTKTKGLTSAIYFIINGKLPDYEKTSTKGKCEADLGYIYDEEDWELLEQTQTFHKGRTFFLF